MFRKCLPLLWVFFLQAPLPALQAQSSWEIFVGPLSLVWEVRPFPPRPSELSLRVSLRKKAAPQEDADTSETSTLPETDQVIFEVSDMDLRTITGYRIVQWLAGQESGEPSTLLVKIADGKAYLLQNNVDPATRGVLKEIFIQLASRSDLFSSPPSDPALIEKAKEAAQKTLQALLSKQKEEEKKAQAEAVLAEGPTSKPLIQLPEGVRDVEGLEEYLWNEREKLRQEKEQFKSSLEERRKKGEDEEKLKEEKKQFEREHRKKEKTLGDNARRWKIQVEYKVPLGVQASKPLTPEEQKKQEFLDALQKDLEEAIDNRTKKEKEKEDAKQILKQKEKELEDAKKVAKGREEALEKEVKEKNLDWEDLNVVAEEEDIEKEVGKKLVAVQDARKDYEKKQEAWIASGGVKSIEEEVKLAGREDIEKATWRRISESNLSDKQKLEEIGVRELGGLNWYHLETDVQWGKQAASMIERNAKILDDPVVTEYVDRIGQRIVQNADSKFPFTIKVLQTEEVNAAALPGGFFYVNAGLILEVDSEAELAGVMAHEIAHVTLRHAARQMTKGDLIQLSLIPLQIILPGLGKATQILIQYGYYYGLPIAFLYFTRKYEAEADYYGTQYLARTGYDPAGLIGAFHKFLLLRRKRPDRVPEIFSSHPPSASRILTTRRQIAEEIPSLEALKERNGTPGVLVSDSEFDQIKERLSLFFKRDKRHKEDDMPPMFRPKGEQDCKDGKDKEGKDCEERPTLRKRH